MRCITAQVEQFFHRGTEYAQARSVGDSKTPQTDAGSGKGKLDVVNNHEWTVGVSLLDFLRDVGKFAKVNTMLSRERCAPAHKYCLDAADHPNTPSQRKEPPGIRTRHLLYGIHLPTPPGVRFPTSVRNLLVPCPGRRVRSVGEHRFRDRLDQT